MSRPYRVLELYCGIGGCAAALGDRAEVVAAVDIHLGALAAYERNFSHPTLAATLEAIPAERFAAWNADLWWLSPPCQPFTRRGRGRDDADPRSRSLLALIGLLEQVAPRALALENVPGFQGSRTHGLLLDTLAQLDFEVREESLCPTALGIPNRRERFYLVAGRDGLREPVERPVERRALAEFLEDSPDEALTIDPELAGRYRHALDVVSPDDPEAVAACFTSAYGRSPVRSGSYLAAPDGRLRRFSPVEILRLLGFPADYSFPAEISHRQAWRLAGNSLSVPAVKRVLEVLL